MGRGAGQSGSSRTVQRVEAAGPRAAGGWRLAALRLRTVKFGRGRAGRRRGERAPDGPGGILERLEPRFPGGASLPPPRDPAGRGAHTWRSWTTHPGAWEPVGVSSCQAGAPVRAGWEAGTEEAGGGGGGGSGGGGGRGGADQNPGLKAAGRCARLGSLAGRGLRPRTLGRQRLYGSLISISLAGDSQLGAARGPPTAVGWCPRAWRRRRSVPATGPS